MITGITTELFPDIALEGGSVYPFSPLCEDRFGDGRNSAFLRLRNGHGLEGEQRSADRNDGCGAEQCDAYGWLERVHVTVDRTQVSGSEVYYADMVLDATDGMAGFACPK